MICKTYDIDEVMEQGRDFHIEARVSFCNVDGIQIESVEITEWINDGSEEIKHGEDAELLKMLRPYIDGAIADDSYAPTDEEIRQAAYEQHIGV
jgi:hypothetical protein